MGTLLFALTCSAPAARGQTLTRPLDALLPGGADAGGVDVAGWRFSEFSFTGAGGLELDPSAVGVRFESLGDVERRATVHFFFDTSMQPTQVGTFTLGYRADFAPSDFVTRFGTQLGGAIPLGTFPGSLDVDETISSLDGSDLVPGAPVSGTHVINLFNDGSGRLEDQNSGFTALNIMPGLRLEKRVLLTARDVGQPSLVFTGRFLSVPELGSFALFAAACAVLLRRRRLRRRGAHAAPLPAAA